MDGADQILGSKGFLHEKYEARVGCVNAGLEAVRAHERRPGNAQASNLPEKRKHFVVEIPLEPKL